MYHVSVQGVHERMINVHYYYYFVWRLNKDLSRLRYLKQHTETCKATMLLTDLETKFDKTK